MRARKGIDASRYHAGVDLGPLPDGIWSKIASTIPDSRAAKQLRQPIIACCSSYLTQRLAVERAAATAAAVRRPGKRQVSHLEQVAEGLRKAAGAWAKIDQRKLYDDRLSDLRTFNSIEGLAVDAERRLREIKQFDKPSKLENPWPAFVRSVAECCRKVGMKPTATCAVYDVRRPQPSWFQELVVAINDNVLGDQGGHRHSKMSQYAAIAKALRVTRSRAKP